MWFLYYKVDRNITKFYHILLSIGLYLKFMSMKIKSKSIGWFASEGLYANFLCFLFRPISLVEDLKKNCNGFIWDWGSFFFCWNFIGVKMNITLLTCLPVLDVYWMCGFLS